MEVAIDGPDHRVLGSRSTAGAIEKCLMRQGKSRGKGRFREPPAPVPLHEPFENLRARLIYIQDELGLNLNLVALTAQLSEKALRKVRDPDWNPTMTTAMKLDKVLTEHMAYWIELARRARE